MSINGIKTTEFTFLIFLNVLMAIKNKEPLIMVLIMAKIFMAVEKRPY